MQRKKLPTVQNHARQSPFKIMKTNNLEKVKKQITNLERRAERAENAASFLWNVRNFHDAVKFRKAANLWNQAQDLRRTI